MEAALRGWLAAFISNVLVHRAHHASAWCAR